MQADVYADGCELSNVKRWQWVDDSNGKTNRDDTGSKFFLHKPGF